MKKVMVVGIGPGAYEQMTIRRRTPSGRPR